MGWRSNKNVLFLHSIKGIIKDLEVDFNDLMVYSYGFKNYLFYSNIRCQDLLLAIMIIYLPTHK